MKSVLRTTISFGLVNIPVKVYSAAEEKEVEFTLLHDKCKTPLKYKRWCPKCEEEVAWENTIKGFELTKNEFIPITKEELESLKLKTVKSIEILKFVEQADIDPIYMSNSYYLVPENSEKAYSLFKEVLQLTGKVAIGKVVMRNKEHLVMIRAFKKGLVMTILHFASEIRDINSLEELKNLPPVKENELKLAQALVSQLEGKFNIKEYKDRFKDAVIELIKKKVKGKIEIKKEEEKPIEDLMEALKKSIKVTKKKKVKSV